MLLAETAYVASPSTAPSRSPGCAVRTVPDRRAGPRQRRAGSAGRAVGNVGSVPQTLTCTAPTATSEDSGHGAGACLQALVTSSLTTSDGLDPLRTPRSTAGGPSRRARETRPSHRRSAQVRQ